MEGDEIRIPRYFEIDEIMYDATTKYKGLVEAIATQLMIATSVNNLEIRYIISDRCPTMIIHNDTSVQVYLEQKKTIVDFFLKYPLYVTILDKSDGVIHQTEGAIVCVGQQCSKEKNEQKRKLFSKDCFRLIGISPNFEEFEEERVDIICYVTNINIAVKQTYKDKQTLVNVMELYAFMKQFSYRTERSSGSSYYLVCVVEDCTWFLHSSRINKSKIFKIKKYCDIHTCSIKDLVYARLQGMTKVIARLILGNYVDTKRIYTPSDIVFDMMREHGISLDYHQAWQVKTKAVKILRGDPTESYQKISGYLYMLKKHYPGSVVTWKKVEENRFLYAFVALDASIREWKYCRPIVVVDGAALKSLYGGTMLIASTLDPGCHILPLAYAVKASNEFLHTVSNGAKRFIVCLRSIKCSCGEFQLDEIPCSHVMTAITYRNQHGENYCSLYYNNKNFRDAYAILVNLFLVKVHEKYHVKCWMKLYYT
ncbi:hypothetical protein P3S68_013947 [Capsicum galapagoense]